VARQRGAEVQFAPGTIIAGRYRISSILGSGGMGEVYRADDTKLGQTVALKFLPARLAKDAVLLGRLHDEVRLGRQVAHPNVCHIYDIVDWESAHFVAMEYVDGEDLSRLLRRIGRLAHDKAVDIARGIAAGLMAAHAKGILHRDLKPANVMVDARGDARVMDFGLALAAGEDDGTISGTPAYMAPEQLEGQPATVQSDLYALGLVMYELFTGKRAHNARTLPERVREISSQITTPSDVIRDIDPAVERIILRCLANDPDDRPRSAREVIASLPGGDPLAAAMAAGETPSPRIVAAAGAEGSLKPWQAWTMLGAVLLLTGLVIAGKQRFGMGQYAGFEKSPARGCGAVGFSPPRSRHALAESRVGIGHEHRERPVGFSPPLHWSSPPLGCSLHSEERSRIMATIRFTTRRGARESGTEDGETEAGREASRDMHRGGIMQLFGDL
jgi:serine/threonine-protein kinase